MAAVQQLMAQQALIADEIDRIISIIKKAPLDRRTLDFYHSKWNELTNLWQKFEKTENQIRNDATLSEEDPYIQEDLHKSTGEKYSSIIEYIESQQNKLTPCTKPVPSTRERTPETLSARSAGLARRLKARTTALTCLLRGLSLKEEVHPAQFYLIKSETIKKLWTQIQELYDEIWQEVEDLTKLEIDENEYHKLDGSVQSYLIELAVLADQHKQLDDGGSQLGSNSAVYGSLPLPKVTIPQFNGDCLKWSQFYELFTEMVDKQPLPKVQKMWYLKSNVSGEAAKLINHLSLSEENYKTAWTLLQERYANKRVIVATLVDKILNQPTGTLSSASIKTLHDTTKECLLALNNLNINTASWDAIMIQLMIKKLDRALYIQFIQSLSKPKDVPTMEELFSFLEMQFQSMDSIGHKDKLAIHQKSNRTVSSITSMEGNDNCKLCTFGSHPIYHCKKFLQMTEAERLRWAQQQKLCVNCLKADHAAKVCTSSTCKMCNKKHNTLLHLQQNPQNRQKTSSSPGQPTNKREETIAVSSASMKPAAGQQNYVMLATANIIVKATNGISHEFRAILDSGSQVNIVTERLIKKLSLSPTEASLCIDGVGRTQKRAQYRINVEMSSTNKNYSANLEAIVLSTIIPAQPNQNIDVSTWNIPSNIHLADSRFYQQGKIDILLGAEFYFNLMQPGTIQLTNSGPTLQNTLLGWIVGGSIQQTSAPSSSPPLTCAIFGDESSLERAVENLWKLDEIESNEKTLSPSDAQCESHFIHHTQTNMEGRFIVSLPFRENPTSLGDSHAMAYNRFIGLERRLQKNEDIRIQYIQFMREYEQLGHMQRVNIDDVLHPRYFIPHHCVLKPDSTTTKLRVVFDASAKTSTGYSLNDLMYTGPVVQSELFSILIRFRLPKFVFTTDIEKMYRQILINPNDHQYQLILWRESPSSPLCYYRLNTVTYGTRAAPYLATKCLQKIANENSLKFPYGSQMLKDNFYVDDGLGGSDSLKIALEMQHELIIMLKKHGFSLKKWCANHPQLLRAIPAGDQEVNLDFDNNGAASTIKTLGLYWVPKSDNFCVKVKLAQHKQISKRTVTSDLAKLFDPLGLLAPVVVKAKIFIQHLWHHALDWDEPLTNDLCASWNTFRKDLENLNNFKIPRHIFQCESPVKTQLHVFADASEKAYAAVAYMRATLKSGQVIVRVLCAKSRVAPLKQQTLPRLELCAAVLAAQLAHRLKVDMQFQNQPIFLWTDSEIVLSWINAQSSSYKTFVANRVSTIQALTLAEQWRHVRSKDNPADVASRGIRAADLPTCNLWLYGPLFLHGREELWPKGYSTQVQGSTDIERKNKAVPVTATTVSNDGSIIYGIHHKNSFRTLQKTLGYVLRFINNSKIHNDSRPKHISLSPIELNDSRFKIVKAIQVYDFNKEICELKKNNQVDKSSIISSLSPFLDENDILRVGGRLEASNLSYDAKHPILLPYNDSISKLILTMFHEENYHCGPQALLAISRQQYWIIKGKSMTRSIVQNCVRCTRAKPKLFTQVMGNLPASRVTPSRPFVKTGVDYCGPFWVHYKVRGKKPHKVYIAVFVCFSTKAVHLEVVTELTTDAFIGALKRFLSRRGRCQTIYSDNATNFLGARNQLEELNKAIFANNSQEKIMQSCSKEGIEFKFIPPRAPHFGGLWEAAVKSAKQLLLRSVSTASLTHEEFETVIIEIEAILNSRPLTPTSSDPNDLAALTPGHFLIGEPLTAQVDSRAVQSNNSLATRWKLVSQLKHEFWRRWSSEYLHQLQEKQKWKSSCENVKEGQMVVIKDDNLPVMSWPLGRILQTHEGNDGKVRVADVQTISGVKRRPIHRLAPLLHEVEAPASEPSNAARPIPADEADTPPTKKSKTTINSISLAMIVTLLLIPVAMGNHIKIDNFRSDPGLYFEGIGNIKLATAEWKLMVYYDLDPFFSELNTFQSGIVTLQHVCSIITHRSTCNIVIDNFNRIKEDLLQEKELFATGRRKRGAFNIVGNVARSLFGVLDSDYANEMSDTIKRAKGETDYIVKLLKNQTSIIDSTVNIIKQDEFSTQEQLKEIVEKINVIAKEAKEASQIELLSLLATQLTLTALNLQRIEKEIIDVLTDAHHEKISPLLLSPHQLLHELTTIKAHLPIQRTLPIEDDNLVKIYKLMRVNGAVTKDEVLFEIRLPLVDQQFLELLKVIPVPTVQNNALVSINPDEPFLAVNSHRDEFIPFTDNDLTSCIISEKNTYICHNKQLRFKKDANSCEINILNSLNTANCNLTRLAHNSTWTQFKNPNKWIFATTTKIEISAVCGTNVSHKILRGTGIMQIEPNCIIKTNLLTIQGHFDASNSLHTSYVQFKRINEISTPQEIKRILTNTTNQDEGHLNQLNELQKQLKESTIIHLPELIRSQSQHHHAVSYTALFISLIILLTFTIIRLRSTQQERKTHQDDQPKPHPVASPRPVTIDISKTATNKHLSPSTISQRGGEC